MVVHLPGQLRNPLTNEGNAMKKNLRKLSLSRDTLRTLTGGGGIKPSPLETMTNCLYYTTCDYTLSCTCPGACETA